MAHIWANHRAPNYEKWAKRPTPQWFKDSKLGIFIHWGTYSVPAFAETSGELGRIPESQVHKHNPYAEWYFNTIRFPDSEARKYHNKHYGDVPYDDLIDKWSAKDFNPDKWVELFAKAGAQYVVPVTKHHDGVTLWEAPETGKRNTVHRGPKQDLVHGLAKATTDHGLKFGVYYSTGIDWHKWPTKEPWHDGHYDKPGLHDHEYNNYAWKHCADLIERYKPHVLWGDINWPEAGVAPGPYSVEALLQKLYGANPEAVINDRFGDTHWDFSTVEYGLGEKPKPPQMWQSCRGIGKSFGYNRMETAEQYMSGVEAIRLLVDVSSEGGNLLLNVGPDEAGNIPDLQTKCLEYMGEYMSLNSEAINGSEQVSTDLAKPTGKDSGDQALTEGWVRWLRKGSRVFAFVDAPKGVKEVKLEVDEKRLDLSYGKLLNGDKVEIKDGVVALDQIKSSLRPICIEVNTT